MRRKFFIPTLAFILIFGQPALCAAQVDLSRRIMDDWAVGTIQRLSRNTIEILDEDLNGPHRFVFLGSGQDLHVGDRVRIFFDPSNGTVRLIKKMTRLEYRREGQNLGYVQHQ
jgi:hypothetical protein